MLPLPSLPPTSLYLLGCRQHCPRKRKCPEPSRYFCNGSATPSYVCVKIDSAYLIADTLYPEPCKSLQRSQSKSLTHNEYNPHRPIDGDSLVRPRAHRQPMRDKAHSNATLRQARAFTLRPTQAGTYLFCQSRSSLFIIFSLVLDPPTLGVGYQALSPLSSVSPAQLADSRPQSLN